MAQSVRQPADGLSHLGIIDYLPAICYCNKDYFPLNAKKGDKVP